MSTLAGVQEKLKVVQKQVEENKRALAGRNLTRKVRAEYRKSVAARVQNKLQVVQNQVGENKRALLGRNKELQNNMLDVDFQVDALAGVGSEFLDDKKKTIVLNCLNHAKANKLHTQKHVAALQLDVDYWLGDERRLKEQYIQSKSQTDMLFGRLAICDLLFGRLARPETGNDVDLADLAERRADLADRDV